MLRVHAEFTHRHRYARVIELENGVFSFDVAPDTEKSIEGDMMTVDEEGQNIWQRWSLFSKALLLYGPSSTFVNKSKMIPHDTSSCTFDLTSPLGLLQGQEDEDVSKPHVFSRDSCRRISRHSLVFLVSQHLQKITVGKKSPQSVTSVIMETSLGRFTCYTHQNRNVVDFDARTCSSKIPLIPEQKMDEILLGARGYYLINYMPQNEKFVWRRCSNDSLEFIASGNFFGIPKAVIYMPTAILKQWKQLETFSQALFDAVNSVLKNLNEPASFAVALENLPQDYGPNLKNRIPMTTIVERLAACLYLCRALSIKNLFEMDFDAFRMFALMNMADITEAHQHFRSPAAQFWELFQTSRGRFMRLLRQYKKAEPVDQHVLLQNGLLGLLRSNSNNVCLVVFQGFLAILVRWNCCRVLSRAYEAPEEWIKFVIADDDDIYMS